MVWFEITKAQSWRAHNINRTPHQKVTKLKSAARSVWEAVKTWLSYRNDTTIAVVFQANKTKGMLFPLVIINLRIPGLIWQGTVCFVQINIAIIPPCDTERNSTNSSFHAGRRWLIFGAKLEAWTLECFIYFALYNLIWFRQL